MAFEQRSEERASQMTPQTASLRQTIGLLASLPEVEPPADLRKRVEAGLAQARDLQPANCAQVAESVDAYLDGELSRTEERSLHLHLVACSACRREVQQAHTAVRLTQGLHDVAPPARVRDRVGAEMAARARPRRRLRPVMRRVLISAVPLAAAAALVLAVRTQVPETQAPGAVATAPAVTGVQPAEQPAAPAATTAVAVEPEAAATVMVARKPAAVRPRKAGRVRSVMAHIGESLTGGAAVAAGEDVMSGEVPAPAPEEIAKDATAEPEATDGTAEIAELEYLFEPEAPAGEKLAMLPDVETTPTPPEAEAEVSSSARLPLGVAVVEATALPEPARRTLSVPRMVTAWPKAISIKRNEPRTVNLPLFRKTY